MAHRRPVKRRTAVTPTAAATGADALCEDLLLEILTRLPSPALSRFKSVCKRWRCRLIPSILRRRPNLAFIRLRDMKPQLLCFTHDGALRRDLSSHSLFNFHRLADRSPFPHHLLTFCNGMALAEVHPDAPYIGIYNPYPGRFIFRDYGPNCAYGVINPVDGKRRFIPPPAIPPPLDSRLYQSLLAFDPLHSPLHFKLVLWAERMDEPASEAAFLFSSRSNDWRRMVNPPALPYCVDDELLVIESSHCLDGRAYRITSIIHSQVMNVLTVHVCIAVFHIKEETLNWIESPKVSSVGEEQDEDRCTYSLGESGGSLVYAYRGGRFLSVWALINDDWSLEHRVDIRLVYPRSWSRVSSFSFHPEDTDIMFLIIQSEILFIFNLKTLKLQEFCKLGRKYSEWSIHPFLCSPNFEKPCPEQSYPLKEF